jgi:prevent-host-death family protein
MKITTVSSREFNQHRSGVKKAAAKGPVFVTDRGKTTHVLLTIEDYERMKSKGKNILELLALPPGVEDIELEIPERKEFARGADFS